jgi:hypothetical protein
VPQPATNTVADAAYNMLVKDDSTPKGAPKVSLASAMKDSASSSSSSSSSNTSAGWDAVASEEASKRQSSAGMSKRSTGTQGWWVSSKFASLMSCFSAGASRQLTKGKAASSSSARIASVAVEQARRADALQAQGREAVDVYAAGIALVRSGAPMGLEWEENHGGIVNADAVREDRWMLMPYEAAAALRTGEDLSWLEAGRRASRQLAVVR